MENNTLPDKSDAFVLVANGPSNKAFERQAIAIQAPTRDEVFVEVESFGLNYADVMARRGLYREAPPLPCVIGYEVVGKVLAVGDSEQNRLIGKRVVGFTRFGGYSNYVNCKLDAVVEIDDMVASEALALSTQGVTAFYMAQYCTPIHKGDRVLIHAAAGGVGTLLIQLAKKAGAIVYAKVSSEEKMKLCTELGADFVINYKKQDYHEQLRTMLGDHLLDVVYNPVGGSTFKPDWKLLGSGGRMIVYGGSELSQGKWGVLSQLNFVRKMGVLIPVGLMMSSKNLLGVNMLKIADHKPNVLRACLEGIIEVKRSTGLTIIVGGEFEANRLADAHDLLESGKSVGKISVKWS